MTRDNVATSSTVIITGANRGIGRGITEAFAESGSNLVLCAREVNYDFENFCGSLEDNYQIKVHPVTLDLMSKESINSAVKTIFDLRVSPSTLINNAGIASGSYFQLTSERNLREVFETNFFGTFFFSQGISKLLSHNKNASIINISSVAALDPKIGTSVYGASKAALNYLSLVMAQELVKFGIRVNVVAPGITETDMFNEIDKRILPEILNSIAMGRPARIDEIASTVLFLASEKSSYINGQVIRVDGGRN